MKLILVYRGDDNERAERKDHPRLIHEVAATTILFQRKHVFCRIRV